MTDFLGDGGKYWNFGYNVVAVGMRIAWIKKIAWEQKLFIGNHSFLFEHKIRKYLVWKIAFKVLLFSENIFSCCEVKYYAVLCKAVQQVEIYVCLIFKYIQR